MCRCGVLLHQNPYVPAAEWAPARGLPFLLKPKKRFVAFRVGDWLCLLHPWGLNVTLKNAAGKPLFLAEEGSAVRWVPPRAAFSSFKPTKAWVRRVLTLESVYLTELHAWARFDAIHGDPKAISRADRYERRDKSQGWPRAVRAAKTKQRLNTLIVEAASCSESSSDIALILDGSEGQTCRGLTGKLPQLHCLAPNVAPETQQALEQLDRCFSWCGRIEDFLRCDLSSLGAVRLCYLDHTGCFASRASHIEAAFRSGVLRPGSVLACTFSMRHSPVEDVASRRWLPTGRWGRWSQALALFALITVLRSCAHAVALDVVGIDLPGLNDYDLSRGACAGQMQVDFTNPAASAVEALRQGALR